MKYEILEITEPELDKLRTELGAITDRFRGKGEEGGELDTLEFTRSGACKDLALSPAAEKISGGFSSARVDLLFDHPEFGQVRVRVSTLQGSIYFVRAVPEAVIDYVFDALRRVKGL